MYLPFVFMTHLQGLVLFALFLPGTARRSIHIVDSRHDAQQQANSVTKTSQGSADTREAILPQGLGQALFRRQGLLARASRAVFHTPHGQPLSTRDTGPNALQRLSEFSHNRSRFPPPFLNGPHRATVALLATGGPKEDKVRAVLFDADGTLLDSLPPHIDFLHQMNTELGLGLSLPDRSDVAACRQITAAPMDNFFRAAGFPESVITRCVEAYEARFAEECPVLPFPGVDSLLKRLSAMGVRTAVVSSNTAVNVQKGLGEDIAAQLEFIYGIDNAPADKVDAIVAALTRLGVEPAAAAYVGDTEKDCIKATAAGVRFIGSDYGFEALALSGAIGGAMVAHSVGELEDLICSDPIRE